MNTVRITKEFTFEMAHALSGHDGPCRFIHGHSYTLSVTVCGKPVWDENSPVQGMVMDFSALKKIVLERIISRFDHALVLNRMAVSEEPVNEMYEKLVLADFQPTSENLLLHFAMLLRDQFPPGVSLHSMRLRETATSYAEWFSADNE